MIPKDKLVCYCNDATVADIMEIVKSHNITNFEELVEQEHAPLGDVCEACHENGYENDGISLACILGLIKTGRLN